MGATEQTMTTEPQYRVTRLFIGGTLAGLTHTTVTSHKVEVGFECRKPIGGSPYRIIAVEVA